MSAAGELWLVEPPAPAAANDFLVAWVEPMRTSYQALTGRSLIDPALDANQAAQRLFDAPFALLAHNTAADPLMRYANRTGLALFELDWAGLLQMPSRYTAEAPDRSERERLLQQVRGNGFIDNYAGVRISSSGRRFAIERATVWNVTAADGQRLGQAATFSEWCYL